MDKLKMQSQDVIGSNIQKIAQLFPNCVTERLGKDGKPELAIDFEKLQEELSNDVLSEGEERYQFTWPDKRVANNLANTPTTMTLRPCREESVDFDNTENLYIEGDNLDVLKVLRETYLGKVKMIYIDPPYNTGNDLVYNDEFSQELDEYKENSGQYDEEGGQLVQNAETNGRFHTDWLNMMYPRLKVARDLLTDDGVIFISIDDHEQDNLRKLCNEIFGASNLLCNIVNINNPKGRSDEHNFATSHEYLLVYQKKSAKLSGFEPDEKILKRYNKNDEKGKRYRLIDLRKTGDSDRRVDRPKMFYHFMYNENTKDFYPTYDETVPDGYISITPQKDDNTDGRWRVGLETAISRLPKLVPTYMSVKHRWTVMEKDYLSDELRVKSTSTWNFKDVNSERGTEQFVELGFDKNIFPRPKPLGTILRTLILSTNEDDIILDFFSGSATTAHATMLLNSEDGGNRQFIMVQIPEPTDNKSEAYKAGYKNICEIGKERIRRAGKKIKEESPLTTQDLDTGFRVLKLDSSNMEDVYYTPQEFDAQSLFNENVKADRTNEDLLFQVMLDLGIELSAKIEAKQIDGKTIHFVDDNYLVACFDEQVNETTITEIAKLHPVYFVMRDASAANDNVIDNFEQIFKAYSKDTVRKIL